MCLLCYLRSGDTWLHKQIIGLKCEVSFPLEKKTQLYHISVPIDRFLKSYNLINLVPKSNWM